MTLDIARRMIEEKRKLGVDVAATVETCMGMMLCTPEEAAQLLQEYGIASEKQQLPVLQIDWGIDPKPGPNLSPEFTLLGLETKTSPLVHFPLDPRIPCNDWNPTPSLEQNQDGNWYFHQSLRLEEPGQYLFKVTLIDPTPERTNPGCYRCDFRVTAVDPDNTGQARSLEISAEGLLTANLANLEQFDHVKIIGGSNILLNAPNESKVTEKIAELLQPNQKKNKPSFLTPIPFISAGETVAIVPYISVLPSRNGMSRATLAVPGHPPIHLIADNYLTFGRDVPEENRINDVPLLVSPVNNEDPQEAEFLAIISKLFSRDHARLEVTSEGANLFDDRKSGMNEGIIINNQPLERNGGKRIFDHEGQTGLQTVLFSKMFEQELMPHYESFWENMSDHVPKKIVERLYQSGDCSDPQLSAISVKPCRYLKQYQHAEALKNALRKTSLAESPWLDNWLTNRKYDNPFFGKGERILVVRFVRLGGKRAHVIQIPGRIWHDVSARILNINGVLYFEHISNRELPYTISGGHEEKLPPFRPIPVQSNLEIRQNTSVLQFS